jgi:NADH:ubiquinone oxidoreductase subunit 3 (subunit A)
MEVMKMDFLLSPPVAFLIYIPLVIGISLFGKALAGPEKRSAIKESVYSSGEEAPVSSAVPGYWPFFLIAFFFAILHLGMLVLGTGQLNLQIIPYLLGLILALLALLLG